MMEYVTFNNGVQMPLLGYGVYQVGLEGCEQCVRDAIDVGYRAIDTAQVYGNEAGVRSPSMKKRKIGNMEISAIGFVAFSPMPNEFLGARYGKNNRYKKTDYGSFMPQFFECQVAENRKTNFLKIT